MCIVLFGFFDDISIYDMLIQVVFINLAQQAMWQIVLLTAAVMTSYYINYLIFGMVLLVAIIIILVTYVLISGDKNFVVLFSTVYVNNGRCWGRRAFILNWGAKGIYVFFFFFFLLWRTLRVFKLLPFFVIVKTYDMQFKPATRWMFDFTFQSGGRIWVVDLLIAGF